MSEFDSAVLALVRKESSNLIGAGSKAHDLQHATMGMRQAWKAFRMGVIASGYPIPDGDYAQDFWRVMRNRFHEWYAQYVASRLEKIDHVEPGSVRKPFNPPRRRREL